MIDRLKLKSALAPTTFAVLGAVVLALGWHDVRRVDDYAPAAEPGQAVQGTPALAPAAATTPPRAGLDVLALFGTPDAAPVEAPPPPPPPTALDESELPDSTAGYQLFGIIEADVASRGRAFIGTAGGDQREYRVGADMPDGARVHAVRERAVIFDRNGEFERLVLPSSDESPQAGTGGPGLRPRRVPGARGPGSAQPSRYTDPYGAPPGAAPPGMPSSDVPMPPTDVPMDGPPDES